MYELFKSNEQDESLLLLEDGINYDDDGFRKQAEIEENEDLYKRIHNQQKMKEFNNLKFNNYVLRN